MKDDVSHNLHRQAEAANGLMLPHVFRDMPISSVFDADGKLQRTVQHYQRQGVVRVIAGPHACHVVVDIQRPYSRPPEYITQEQST